jgi:hypothetical protein
MLPKDLTKFTLANIQEGYDRLKSENDRRMGPLRELMSQGKALSKADEEFLDNAGNMVDEFLVLEKIKNSSNVFDAAKTFSKDELKTLELLIYKFEHKVFVDPSSAKPREYLILNTSKRFNSNLRSTLNTQVQRSEIETILPLIPPTMRSRILQSKSDQSLLVQMPL